MTSNIIFNEDVEITLSGMPESSVDIAFSDPPYNKHKNYEVYQDDLPEDEYWDWMERIVCEYRRISRKGIILYLCQERIRGFWNLIPTAKLIIVRKGALGTPARSYFRQYFAVLSTVTPRMRIYDHWDGIRLPGEGYFYKEERFPNPGQTGLQLTQRIINYFTEIGDVVYDGFMGCGTTAVACLHLGRKYIGSELNPRYVQVSNERIQRYETQTNWFLQDPRLRQEVLALGGGKQTNNK